MKAAKQLYGIVVTYKNLYLGNSKRVWDQFLKNECAKLNGCIENEDLLPIENLFFIDLRTWDRLMCALKTSKDSLNDVLEAAKNADSDPATTKFSFDMHLDKYAFSLNSLDYLKKANDEFEANYGFVENPAV